MTTLFILTIVFLTLVVLALIAGSYLALNRISSDYAHERLRWAAEREALMAERRYLNDRYLAKHAAEAVHMDRAAQPPVERDERQRIGNFVPEGL